MANIYQIPDSNANNNGVPGWLPYVSNGGGFGGLGGNGWGGGILGFLIGLMFGNGGFGNGIFGGAGNNANTAMLANAQQYLMEAINHNGERATTAVQNLATMLGQDFNAVNSAVQTIQSSLNTIAVNQGTNALQIVNAIQSGNCQLANQFRQCCCENKQLVMQQGYESQIATLNQTNQLGSQADRNTNSVINAINQQTIAMNDHFCQARERDMQAKIDTQAEMITQLRGQIDNANQTAQITNYVNAVVAPLQSKVDQIASKQLPTVPVQYPNITAVNTTPFANGYGYGYGNGFVGF